LPEDSSLVGKSLTESRLGDAFGLGVMGIVREGRTNLMPAPEEKLLAGDTLLVKGKKEDLLTLEGLQNLEIDSDTPPDLADLESEDVGLIETVLSPHTTLVGKTLRELHFRAKYGLTVLAIWREGQAYRSNLRDMALRFGDALLLYGPREKFNMLGSEPDFVVLTEEAQEAPRRNKTLLSVLVMVVVLLPVILGWVNIAIATVVGVVLMILTGCLTIEEAHRSSGYAAAGDRLTEYWCSKFSCSRDGQFSGWMGSNSGPGWIVYLSSPGFPGDAQPGSGCVAGPDRAEHSQRSGNISISSFNGCCCFSIRSFFEPRWTFCQHHGDGSGRLSLLRLY
jgi:K+/H+ antiporter YhaU regulatory subunit KhtT